MSDQKIKTAAGKVPLDLVPLQALKGAARVFQYGAKKYARGNWHSATDDEFTHRYVGGALRHLADAQNPDGTFDFKSLAATDAESGLPEVDHLICGLLMLRGLLIKRDVLRADPGVPNDPPHGECDCRECVRMQTTCDLTQLELPFATSTWSVPVAVPK